MINALSKKINNWITEFKETDFDKVAKSGRLVLFLDGFDEVPRDNVTRLINEVEEWCERYPSMQIIISSRPEADIQSSNYLKVLKLSEYQFYEQSLLIDKLVKEIESNELLKQAIKDSNTEIQELLKTPLMVTLFVMNYRGSLEIPTNQHEFYKNLFTILISRHDKTKPGFKRESNSGLNEVQLQEVFEEFCFITFSMDILVFDDSKAIEVLKECLENQNIRDNPRMVLYDLSKNVCLILKDGFDYTFIHKSIQEFYYASFIHNQPEMKIEFYKDCNYEFVNGKHNILKFLESMDTYYFYKYLALPVFDAYIKYFNFDENKNQLINYFFYNSNEEYGIHIEFYFEIYYEYPFNYFDILIVKLLPTVLNASSEFGAGMLRTTKVNSEGGKSIQSLFTLEKYNELRTTLDLFEQKVLERREEILSFIDKKDSKKYRKYLNV